MRRRTTEPEQLFPDGLDRFDPSVWDAEAWIEARKEWVEEHGWPGDPIDRIREHRDAKRRLATGGGGERRL